MAPSAATAPGGGPPGNGPPGMNGMLPGGIAAPPGIGGMVFGGAPIIIDMGPCGMLSMLAPPGPGMLGGIIPPPGGIAPGIIGIPGGAIIPPGGIAGIWAPACTTPGFMLTALSGTLCIISCLACQLLTGGALRYGAAIGTGSPHGPVKPGTVGVEYWPEARTVGSPWLAGPWLVDMQPPIAAASIKAPTRRFMKSPPLPGKCTNRADLRCWRGARGPRRGASSSLFRRPSPL